MELGHVSDVSLPLGTLRAGSAVQKNDGAPQKEVGEQFEAMFVQHLLSGMRQATLGGRKDFARQSFEQMFDEEVAKAVSAQGLGLGELLFAAEAPVCPQDAPATDDRAQ